ncbi:MAG TPA: SUMF1/EgtB/PvdO family nonheme iron enzyme [Elusimicrobiota bacterium]|nr:SUMF1/EgtB/PvdO family nonheme iron enzyme [Elusimicrobiota bacterium]
MTIHWNRFFPLFSVLVFAPLAMRASAGEQGAKAKSGADAAVNWVKLPSGTFQMGSDQWSETRPVHEVSIKSFELSKTPVTNKQYRACVAAKACAPVKDCGAIAKGDDLPVTCVDWAQAAAFAKWVGGRLPSDSEWEYAARDAGKSSKYPWGKNTPTLRPVCADAKATTAQGLCDMTGTVWEWVQDWYHPGYDGAPKDGTAWVDSGWDRVYVGGDFYFHDRNKNVVAPCRRLDPAARRAVLGFRVARS